MIVSTFRLSDSGALATDKPRQIGRGQVFVFGENAAIAQYQATRPSWIQDEPEKIVRTFLQIASHDKPDIVGPPMAIVEVTANGVRWIELGLCEKGR